MSMARWNADAAEARFREVAFRRLPLACMAGAAAVAAWCGAGWTETLGPLPWIVSLGFVGLPHGAADFAARRRAYAAAMAAVAAGFAVAPAPAIVAFAAVSCWHFGAAHRDGEPPGGDLTPRPLAALCRGCAVLAMPLAVWPEATARAASNLAALAIGEPAAAALFPAATVRAAGIALAAVTVTTVAAEGLLAARRPGGLRAWFRLLSELATIVGLGWFAAPLFAVGLYFLIWHAWRQMPPLAESLTGSAPGSWRQLGAALLQIHVAAVPLLIPTWIAIGAVWWWGSAGHSLRDLAIVSIGGYLVVTPAHEMLGDLLRALAARGRPQPAASGSRNLPIARNFA
jgi:Brp/Blh family beta-carotene 15,15'-monooxygenase